MANLDDLSMWTNENEVGVEKANDIKKLLRQCSRWAVAAEQDTSPLITLLHANYAAGFLWALKDIASDTEIEEAASIDILEFTKKIVDIQDKSTKNVTNLCPQFIGVSDPFLLQMAGDM